MSRWATDSFTGFEGVLDRLGVVSRPASRAFTLIEVLAATALIAVLISLMLPVLTRARAAARAAVCGSNLRQLALANTTYAVDHGDFYVPGAANMAQNLDRWHGQRSTTREFFDPARGPLWRYLVVPELKQCPQFRNIEFAASGFEAGNGGYGYNNAYVGRDDRTDIFSELGARSDWFDAPARTVMFTDAAFTLPGPLRYIEYSFAESPQFVWGPADPSIHFRHSATANVVWLDGHVCSRSLDFTRPNIYGATSEQNRRMNIGWFGPLDNTLFDRD